MPYEIVLLATGILLLITRFSMGNYAGLIRSFAKKPFSTTAPVHMAGGIDGQVTGKEIGAGVTFGVLNFVFGFVLLFFFAGTYLPSNIIVSQFGGYVFVGLFAFIYAFLMVLVLGFLGKDIISSIFFEEIAWLILGGIALIVSFISLFFYILTFFTVGFAALGAAYIEEHM